MSKFFDVKATLLFSYFIISLSIFAAEQKPNIVLFYIDDWAWYGSPIAMDDEMANTKMPVLQMPNLEKLAATGMKFRNAYGSPQCSPARVCIQTGQSSPRNGFTLYLGKQKDDYYDTRKSYANLPMVPNISDAEIDKDAMTIPEALKPFGYVSAHIGKWHMNGDPGDEGYVVHDGNTNNTPGNTLTGQDKVRMPDDIKDPKLMFSITEKSVKFIEQQAKAKKPFYLQVSHYAMHEGRECLGATRKKYVNHPYVQAYYKKNGVTEKTVKRKDDPAIWLGMGDDLDSQIGVVLNRLKELGLYENTYVIVVSDNGYRHKFFPGMPQPLHAQKWWAWQGGIRVPMVVKGPGIKGNSTFQPNVVNYDFLPTFVEWAGGNPKDLKDIDGVSLAPYMKGKEVDSKFINRNLYFHYPHYRTSMPHSAIISGTKKLIHFYERPNLPMLFDLKKDEAESNNIAKQHPEEHKAMFTQMMDYLKNVKARFPKDNPDYDEEHYKSLKQYKDILRFGPFEGKRPKSEDEK